MITLLFSIFVVLFSILYAFLFSSLSFALINVLYWLLAFVLAIISTAALLALFLFTYGRLQRGDQSLNMRNHKVIMSFMRFLTRLLRLNFHASGLQNIPEDRAFIMVGNHQTNIDIIATKPFVKTQPLIYIAKQSIFHWPIVGRLAGLIGNIPIKRMADRSAIEAIIKGIKHYKRGAPVMIYPEGKRSKSNQMIDFKAGAFKLAIKPQAPIIIVSIYNFATLWKKWPLKRRDVYIHFHEPIEPTFYKDMKTTELSNYVKQTIQTKIDEFAKQDANK